MARTRAAKQAAPPREPPRPTPVAVPSLDAVAVIDAEEKKNAARGKEGELRGSLPPTSESSCVMTTPCPCRRRLFFPFPFFRLSPMARPRVARPTRATHRVDTCSSFGAVFFSAYVCFHLPEETSASSSTPAAPPAPVTPSKAQAASEVRRSPRAPAPSKKRQASPSPSPSLSRSSDKPASSEVKKERSAKSSLRACAYVFIACDHLICFRQRIW